MKRRFIPLLLAAALCLGLLTIGAAAEGPYTADDYRFVNVNGTNILNDPDYTVTCGEGKATFDVETATLTIENATLEGSIEIRFEDAAETSTATVILKGQNSMTTRSSGIYTNGNMVVKADAGASLKIEATGEVNGINAWCNLTIDGGTYDVSSGYPAFYSGNDLTIQGGANVVKATATNDSAIYAANKITITGEGTSVNADAYYCAVFGKTGGVTISNGAALVGHSENDHPVYTNGTLLLNGADVTLTSDYAKATALFANSKAPFNIINSKVNVTTDSTSIFSKGDINITDSYNKDTV